MLCADAIKIKAFYYAFLGGCQIEAENSELKRRSDITVMLLMNVPNRGTILIADAGEKAKLNAAAEKSDCLNGSFISSASGLASAWI